MTNLTRLDPFAELARFDPMWDVDDVISRFMLRPFLRSGLEMEPQIRMDVKEMDNQYLVNAEIPGVKKDDIHVTIDGSRVSITAEVKQEKETREGERMVRSERCYGLASRSFSLGTEIEQTQVKAKYDCGVLELTLPKKAASMQKEITIS